MGDPNRCVEKRLPDKNYYNHIEEARGAKHHSEQLPADVAAADADASIVCGGCGTQAAVICCFACDRVFCDKCNDMVHSLKACDGHKTCLVPDLHTMLMQLKASRQRVLNQWCREEITAALSCWKERSAAAKAAIIACGGCEVLTAVIYCFTCERAFCDKCTQMVHSLKTCIGHETCPVQDWSQLAEDKAAADEPDELNRNLDAAADNKAATDEAEELNRKLDAAARNKAAADEAEELNERFDAAARNKAAADEAQELSKELDTAAADEAEELNERFDAAARNKAAADEADEVSKKQDAPADKPQPEAAETKQGSAEENAKPKPDLQTMLLQLTASRQHVISQWRSKDIVAAVSCWKTGSAAAKSARIQAASDEPEENKLDATAAIQTAADEPEETKLDATADNKTATDEPQENKLDAAADKQAINVEDTEEAFIATAEAEAKSKPDLQTMLLQLTASRQQVISQWRSKDVAAAVTCWKMHKASDVGCNVITKCNHKGTSERACGSSSK